MRTKFIPLGERLKTVRSKTFVISFISLSLLYTPALYLFLKWQLDNIEKSFTEEIVNVANITGSTYTEGDINLVEKVISGYIKSIPWLEEIDLYVTQENIVTIEASNIEERLGNRIGFFDFIRLIREKEKYKEYYEGGKRKASFFLPILIDGEPQAAVKVDADLSYRYRVIQEYRSNILRFGIGGYLVFYLIVFLIFNRMVLNPVVSLTRKVKEYRKLPCLSGIEEGPSDEIANLTFTVHKMASIMKAMDDELERLSTVDSLTGLYNLKALKRDIGQEMQRCRRQQHHLSVIVIDIDSFRKYIESYGLEEGDNLLKKVGEAIKSSVRDSVDKIYRWTGDEFVVVLPEVGEEIAKRIANRIRTTVKGSAFVDVSFGIATMREDMTGDELLKGAEKAMLEMKETA